ncbi:MAG: TMEM165/GDT1 family protein [Thermoplasmata archaeon]
MIWFFVIVITFLTVFVAEIGDKSQFMTISLASKYDSKNVFAGIFSGIAIITLLAVGLGTLLFEYIPILYVKIIASLIFIIFGLYTLFFEDEVKVDIDEKNNGVLWTSFLFSVLAELGDKTQLAVIALTARYASPIAVLVGALIGMGTIIGIGVILGSKLGNIVRSKKINLIAGGLFVVLGTAFLFEAIFLG